MERPMNPPSTSDATPLTQEARDEAVYRALLMVMGDTPRAAAPHEFIRLLEQDGYTVSARRAIEGLTEYAEHYEWCNATHPKGKCDCGLSEALAAIPRPDEPRAERCCTLEPSHPFHIPGHSTYLHPFTPEAR